MRLLGCAGLVAVLLLAVAAGAGAQTTGDPPGTFPGVGCPRDTRPLPRAPLASYAVQVRTSVLQFVRTSLWKVSHMSSGRPLAGARVRSLIPVRHWLPSGWIRRECGLAVWRASVAADVYFPRLDKPHNPLGRCNDCAHTTLIAARTASCGWTIWGRY